MKLAWTPLAVALCLVLLSTPRANAAYKLGPGDVMDVSVFGVADFRRRLQINIDGDVSVPFVGEVGAAGLTLGELRRKLADALVASQMLRTPDVTLELVEYRPFYISGDVSRPGAIAYRPGLTVRHAIALAGGFDALRFKADNPLLAAPEIRSEYENLWTDLVRRQAHILALRAELDGQDSFDRHSLFDAPVARSVVDEIADLETAQLEQRRAAAMRDRAYYEAQLARDSGDLASLSRAVKEQRDVVAEQSNVALRMADAQARGVVASSRVDEDRRALAGLRSQYGDASARLTSLMRDKDDMARQLAASIAGTRAALTRDLQDSTTDADKLKSRLRASSERLVYVGALKAQLSGSGGGPEILIHHKGGQSPIAASEDTAIEPDDVIDVIVRPENLTAVAK